MADRFLILGKGYIGARLREELGYDLADAKIHSFSDAEKVLKSHNPTIIINCIGNIGRNVDECELDKDKTLLSNTFVPIFIAEAALRSKAKLIQISSGCIYHFDYSKDNAIDEERAPDFLELFYSRSKIYSDLALANLSSKFPVLICRIRIPLDNRPHPRNLLDKLIRYRKAIDLANSVTYIPDFISALKHLINIEATGIYNIVNKGGLVYSKLLEIYKRSVPEFSYEVVDFRRLNLVRTNLILSTRKLEQSGFKVRGIEEVLEICLKEYLQYEKKR